MSIKQNFPSIRPSLLLDFANTKQLDPRVTFTRGSAGTYWDGLTRAKAEENLLTYSQEFDNAAWGKGAATVAANVATAPDGTSTADKLDETAVTSNHIVQRTLSAISATVTFSVWIKAAGRGYAFVAIVGDHPATAVSLNLSTGAATAAAGSPANIASVESAPGSGWWRVSFSTTISGTAFSPTVYVSSDGVWANRSYAGEAGSGVYVWGAQLEQRSSVTAYTPTTDQPITKYQPALQTATSGIPRFDHNPVTGESLGLLIEEQRTNLQPYSSDFSNAVWTKTNTTVTAATVVAPDGTLTGSQLVESTGTVTPQLIGNVPALVNANSNISIYVKAVTGSAQRYVYIGAKHSANTRWGYCLFDPNTGLVVNSFVDGIQDAVFTPNVTPVGNGWFRLSMVFNSPLAGQILVIGLTNITTPPNNHTLGSYNGDGTSGIYIWGAQLEAGAFPTSYIPTTTAQVTRAADTASMTGTNFSSWYRQDEGTLCADVIIGRDADGSRFFANIDDGANSNAIDIRSGSIGTISGVVSTGLSQQASLAAAAPAIGAMAKNAVAYMVNDFAFCCNAQTVLKDTSGIVPFAPNRFTIGSYNSGVAHFANTTIAKVAYYPKRLPDAQLQAITA